MRALPILLVFVAILLTCEPSHIRPVKTDNTNDLVQTCSFELPLTAEFRGTNFAWIASLSGDLLYTWNGGGNWSEIDADTIGGFLMLRFADENNGWAINWSGQLWKTENGGQSWNRLGDDSDPNTLSFASGGDFKFIDKSHGWILGPFQIWRTADGGNTWRTNAPPIQGYYSFVSLFFLDSYEGWIGGEYGIVYHTEDGGETWECIEVGSEETEFSDVFFVSKSVGWVKGGRGELFRTLDGGKTWSNVLHLPHIKIVKRNVGGEASCVIARR